MLKHRGFSLEALAFTKQAKMTQDDPSGPKMTYDDPK